MKILVLGGGNSPEREVSQRSAKAVASALETAGFEVDQADPKDGLKVGEDTIVFPILHGQGGEDGKLQKQLEALKVPYLGSDSQASAICFDKSLARQKLQDFNIPVAAGDTVTWQTYASHKLSKEPHVLKVSRGGSSIGTYIVRDPENINQNHVQEVFSLDNEAVIEELVIGNEITVPILDNKALPVIEIVPPQDGEFDYENKYNGRTQELCPPQNVSQLLQSKAQTLATQVHQALGARHLSRIDIIVKPNGDLVVLELNTMPGMTAQSLYPLSAKAHGLEMPELMREFVRLVKRDYKLG